jgi:hypothetical protein
MTTRIITGVVVKVESNTVAVVVAVAVVGIDVGAAGMAPTAVGQG